MKTLLLGLGALLLSGIGNPADAQTVTSFGPPIHYYGGGYGPPPCCASHPLFAYPGCAYYPYPLPPAPSLGFGRGGIYRQGFVGRGESVTGFTLPGHSTGR